MGVALLEELLRQTLQIRSKQALGDHYQTFFGPPRLLLQINLFNLYLTFFHDYVEMFILRGKILPSLILPFMKTF